MGYSLARFNTADLTSRSGYSPSASAADRDLPPAFLLYRGWGLDDTRIGLIPLYTVITLPLSVWMTHGYFVELPYEMEEARWSTAAPVSGCSGGSPCRSPRPASRPPPCSS